MDIRNLSVSCSNCTFMELKFESLNSNLAKVACSNCTFMELKVHIKSV